MFTCPHCGRQTAVFGADQLHDRHGPGTCEHCEQEFLIVNDIPMTGSAIEQRNERCPKHNKRLMLRQNVQMPCNRLQIKELTLTLRSFYKTKR
jgi:hypothetical protein